MFKSSNETGRIATIRVSSNITVQGTYCGQDKEGRHRVQVDDVVHTGQMVGSSPEPGDEPAI